MSEEMQQELQQETQQNAAALQTDQNNIYSDQKKPLTREEIETRIKNSGDIVVGKLLKLRYELSKMVEEVDRAKKFKKEME